tara:strand:- start:5245 stop:6285 length:1041 start_codon:yes stop_codon:yes gene_type:complete
MVNPNLLDLFTYTLGGAMTLILIKMGTTIKYENINIKHPKLFASVFVHQYLLDPLYVLVLSILIKPPLHQLYGMFTVILTPSSAAAAVSAYTVDADVPFALALSIASLIQSIILTPFLFTVMLTAYAQIVKIDSNTIKMPYFRMFLLMSYVLILIGIGYKMRQKMKKELVDNIGYYFEKSAIILLFTATGLFFASPEFKESFGSKDHYSYYGSMLIMSFISLFKAHIPICNEENSVKDSAVLITFRKSPSLALVIAAISFNDVEDYNKILGFVFLYNFIRDWVTMPYLMILRKKRLGHYFYSSVKKAREAKELTESDELDTSNISIEENIEENIEVNIEENIEENI